MMRGNFLIMQNDQYKELIEEIIVFFEIMVKERWLMITIQSCFFANYLHFIILVSANIVY